MKVAIVTTWAEKCGLATYSENIVRSLPDIEWRILGRESWGPAFSDIPANSAGCDVVHIMHHGGLMASMSPEVVWACGKTVITQQCIGSEEVFSAATVKTAHVQIPGYRFVPHGIHTIDKTESEMDPPSIGCCGIPFGGKGHLEAVQIARLAGLGVNLVIPVNPHTSTGMAEHIEASCEQYGIPCQITTDWLDEGDISRILSRSVANIFFYTRSANGISGAVRMGLAAARPVIVSKHSQFQDIIAEGAVTVADSMKAAADMVRTKMTRDALVLPTDLLSKWDYAKTSQMYQAIYNEVVGD